MNKKSAVAVAVGALFSMPALAQTSGSGIEIYGRLYPQLSLSKSSGATTTEPPATFVTGTGGNHDRRWSIDTSNSRIGFRGREQLGGGLSTVWQIETRVRFDTGAGNFWAGGRNSFLGLAGGFGTVKLGNMDTIYKEYGGAVGSFFGISSGNFVASSNVLSDMGLGGEAGVGRDDTGFHIRAPNSIQYETPEFGGFQVGIQYSPDEAKGNPGRLTTRGGDVNADLCVAAARAPQRLVRSLE
jgi:predicted porin